MDSCNVWTQVWNDCVKIAKFVMWVGTGAAAVASLLYGLGLISLEKRNEISKNSIRVL